MTEQEAEEALIQAATDYVYMDLIETATNEEEFPRHLLHCAKTLRSLKEEEKT